MIQWRQTILVKLCRTEFVTLIIPNVADVFIKLNPSRDINFETATQISEELKRMEFDGAFCKKFKLLTNSKIFFIFSAKHRKFAEKMIHQKKNSGHQTSRSLNPGKAQFAHFIA